MKRMITGWSLVGLGVLLFSIGGEAWGSCFDDLFLRPARVGIEYDVVVDTNNLQAPVVSIPGSTHRFASDGTSVSLTVNGSDADGDSLYFFWRGEGSCAFSVDPCDYNQDYTQVTVTVYGGVDSSCVVTAHGSDGRGLFGMAAVSFMQDSDNDMIPNPYDDFPNDPSEWQDTDQDGVGDGADTDDDDDNVLDNADRCPLVNPQGLDVNGDGCRDNLGLLFDSIDTLISHHGIANSLKAKLRTAHKSCLSGEIKTVQNKLKAFVHEVSAQRGKHITAEVAELLVNVAEALIQALDGSGLDQNNDNILDVCAGVSTGQQTTTLTPSASSGGGGCQLIR